jgi:hypothetical protein
MLELQAGRYDAAGPVLCLALRDWLNDDDAGPDFLSRLGLPGSRSRIRNNMRDHHLIAAAELLVPGGSLSVRTYALMEAVALFARLRWLCWQGSRRPPSGANAVEQCLHAAFILNQNRRRRGDLHSIGDWSETYFRRVLK